MEIQMNPRFTEKEWLEDFGEFVSSNTNSPVPEDISKSILNRVHRALNPSSWLVFSKILGIHVVVSTLSLAVCDQFGTTPFKTGISFADYFMKFGHSTCMALCGFLFVGLSVSAACFLLKPEELSVFYRNSFVQAIALSLISIGILMAFGAEILIGVGALWILGAVLGGLAPIHVFTKLKHVSH
jgi:hypothetical protein